MFLNFPESIFQKKLKAVQKKHPLDLACCELEDDRALDTTCINILK